MVELALPIPERGDLFPAGWTQRELVPALVFVDDMNALRSFRTEIDARKAYQEAHGVVSAEALRALAVIDLRMAELLGEPTQTWPGNTSSRSEVIKDKDERHALGVLLRHADVVLRHVYAAEDPKSLTRSALLKIAKQHRRETTPADETEPVRAKGWEVRPGDFRERLADVPDGSVDLILTDPPYPAEDLPLWSDLAAFAKRVLGPRGLLVAYSGQLFLPEVLRRLDEHLTYGWTYCLELRTGSRSRIMGRHIIQSWKPVLVFSTGTWPSGRWHDDLLISSGPDKSDYSWQQDAIPPRRLIENLTPPTGLVVDPFAGTGAFGMAARITGRRFLGAELDPKRFQLCVERIGAAA